MTIEKIDSNTHIMVPIMKSQMLHDREFWNIGNKNLAHTLN